MSLAIGTIGRYEETLAILDSVNSDGSYNLVLLSCPQTRPVRCDAAEFTNPNAAPAVAPAAVPVDTGGQVPA